MSPLTGQNNGPTPLMLKASILAFDRDVATLSVRLGCLLRNDSLTNHMIQRVGLLLFVALGGNLVSHTRENMDCPGSNWFPVGLKVLSVRSSCILLRELLES